MHLIDHWAEDNIYSQNNLLTFKAWHSWQIFFKNQMNRINVLIQGLAILVMEAVAKKKKKSSEPFSLHTSTVGETCGGEFTSFFNFKRKSTIKYTITLLTVQVDKGILPHPVCSSTLRGTILTCTSGNGGITREHLVVASGMTSQVHVTVANPCQFEGRCTLMDTWTAIGTFRNFLMLGERDLTLKYITCCCCRYCQHSRPGTHALSNLNKRDWYKTHSTGRLGERWVALATGATGIPLVLGHLCCQYVSLTEWTRNEMSQMSVMALPKTHPQTDPSSQSKDPCSENSLSCRIIVAFLFYLCNP